jgi:uncharacterized OsmC-like protein/alpha-beta hydrolase superfamily lysophospholipase
MLAERLDFDNGRGQRLAALLNRPAGPARAFALFAHCFACGKDVRAARRIAEGLVAQGIAVLRFDFTGIGASEGEFANTTFSSNVADLVAAADHLRRRMRAPAILIGHSLGGAAVLAAAPAIPEARAVVTIAAPADPAHVKGLLPERGASTVDGNEFEVTLAGRTFRMRREFLDDVSEQRLTDLLPKLHKALLIFHSPTDPVVGIENASKIFVAAKHPKSFVSLAGADHLLERPSDAAYVAHVIAAWAERYLDEAAPAPDVSQAKPGVLVEETGNGRFQQRIVAGRHTLMADEPTAFGGLDSGPSPYDLLLASLGACTGMTLRLYAERKSLPLDKVSVRLSHAKIHAADCENCETKEGMVDRIERMITLHGALNAEQRARLMEIADRCPVHRTLTSEINIRTREGPS